jgi:hypothetical protein
MPGSPQHAEQPINLPQEFDKGFAFQVLWPCLTHRFNELLNLFVE